MVLIIVLFCHELFRRPLFRSSGVLPHSQGAGDAAFDWRNQQGARGKNNLIGQEELCQRSLFIEPVDWMRNDILAMEGKVSVIFSIKEVCLHPNKTVRRGGG